tara:strand:+ start:2905 stop:3183 length:279 start_codon:yes stop_codon:yes gene_type:complete
LTKPKKEIVKQYKKMIDFGCVVCKRKYGVYTQPCIHHLTGAGMGLKNKEKFIPLCHHHHQGKEGIHHLGNKIWEDRFGLQEELLQYYKEHES